MFDSKGRLIRLERRLADFEPGGYNPKVAAKALYENAQRILKLPRGREAKATWEVSFYGGCPDGLPG